MARYFFPTKNKNVESILRNGLALPKGDEPAIYALASIGAAKTFGTQIFGDDMEVLEINGDLATYGTGEEAPVGFVAISQAVPTAAVSRMTRLKNLTEVENSRDYFGGRYDDRAINSTAERTYVDHYFRTFQICRDLDADDRAYRLIGPIVEDIQGLLPLMTIDGAEYFGGGLSWQAAEAMADKAVGENIEQLRDLPRVKVFKGDEDILNDMPHYVQEGIDGNTVEIWEILPEHIDRGRWGNWVDQPGWYWQRMDVAQLHGPFIDDRAAYRDTVENYNEPGSAASPSLSSEIKR
jgi:hypothetical protein